jgi:hypothetical protein
MRFLKDQAPAKQPPMREDGIICAAEFSQCRLWRYSLRRTWAMAGHMIFIGLNPSTADELTDDATVCRCIGFARAWGYGGLFMLNIFAWRDTDPKRMMAAPDPVGPDNDKIILQYTALGGATVVAWGNGGAFMNRGHNVTELIRANQGLALSCLGTTKAGHPKHPLYLPANAKRRGFK